MANFSDIILDINDNVALLGFGPRILISFLEHWAVDRLGTIVYIFCNLYTDLSRHYFDKDEKYFKATPKLHLFLHLAEDQVKSFQINPKQFWCYADEDLVGQLVEIASATHPSSLAELGLIKWLLLTLGPKE